MATRSGEIRFFTRKGSHELFVHRFPGRVTCLEFCKQLKTIFIGTEAGELRCFTWPNNPRRIEQQYPTLQLHESAVTIIRVSNDLSEVVSVSAKGSLYHCSIRVIDKMREVHSLEIAVNNKSMFAVNGLLRRNGIVLHNRLHKTLAE